MCTDAANRSGVQQCTASARSIRSLPAMGGPPSSLEHRGSGCCHSFRGQRPSASLAGQFHAAESLDPHRQRCRRSASIVSRQLPDARGLVPAAGDQAAPSGLKARRHDRLAMTHGRSQPAARGDVPDPAGRIVAGRRDRHAVRSEGDVRPAPVCGSGAPSGSVVETRHSWAVWSSASGDDRLAVRAECRTDDFILVSERLAERLPRTHIPEPCCPVEAGGQCHAAVRAEDGPSDESSMAENVKLAAARRSPTTAAV